MGDNERGQADAVTLLVGEQLRAARAQVFRAYLQSLEKARELAEDDGGAADGTRQVAAEQRFERRRPS